MFELLGMLFSGLALSVFGMWFGWYAARQRKQKGWYIITGLCSLYFVINAVFLFGLLSV